MPIFVQGAPTIEFRFYTHSNETLPVYSVISNYRTNVSCIGIEEHHFKNEKFTENSDV